MRKKDKHPLESGFGRIAAIWKRQKLGEKACPRKTTADSKWAGREHVKIEEKTKVLRRKRTSIHGNPPKILAMLKD